MSSIIEGYNYDIFISYRQKDNKGDRWVSEFVEALKTELESTFKEEVSVYFDIHPLDGLLETHDVDASLKDKLKCLVFIPIISRTYCDPKSFAWEHEFKAFVEKASQDQFGLKVKLSNGNVASRVLPVRIHDLDAADIKECESVLGGVLRGIDFIYKESGIDKPLAPEDDEKKNLNNTKYRIQIIKIAHAIKEIILGMKAEPIQVVKEKDQAKKSIIRVREDERKVEPEKPLKTGKGKLISIVALVAISIIVAIFTYPKIFKRDTLEKLRSSGERISVAVMPFQNMTNDTTLNIWQEAIQYNLTLSLSNYSDELKVSPTESITGLLKKRGLADYSSYASITASVARDISNKLDADIFIYGSINQSGSTIRLNAQLVDSKTEEILKPFQIDGKAENIIPLIDSLKVMVKNVLVISKLGKELSPDFVRFAFATSPEAFRYFKSGQNAFNERDWSRAVKFYSQAIEIDSSFNGAFVQLSMSYLNLEMYDQAKKCCLKLYKRLDNMPIHQKIMTQWMYSHCFETPHEEINYAKQLLENDDQAPSNHFVLGMSYLSLDQYENGIPEYEKALKIYRKLGIIPSWTGVFSHLGGAYHKTGQYKKEEKLYKAMEKYFPDNSDLLEGRALLALTEGDTIDADHYIEKLKFVRKDMLWSEARIISNLAWIYSNAGILDKAEKYLQQALSLEPEKSDRLNSLAWFLINKDRNVNEGLAFVGKALELSPDNYEYLDTKGWGLYKQGKYQEALEILQKSWDLRMKNAIYDHEAFLHLEAAKKAVAGLKSN